MDQFFVLLQLEEEGKKVMWTQRQSNMLANLFGRYSAFPSHGEDEFVIVRENGQRQGIFKEWAPPILPLLSGYEIYEWRQKASQQPAFLEKELRRAWRNSWLIDKDLAMKFAVKPLPENPNSRITELVGRLKQALGLMGPFYHLEAIVDDLAWLGIDASKATPSVGGFDVVAFLLPSAIQQYVLATAGNWNSLDWFKINRLTALALAKSSHAGILLGLAGLLGVPPEHIIFAANALQWIPSRVGGKKEDVSELEAIDGLKKIIEESREIKNIDCFSVLAEMNAKIRFFNWLPLIECPENFEGRNWTYASVCDTADELLRTLDTHPELWRHDFQKVYQEKLRPQILNLDAASAKGRFLLDLIVSEKKLAVGFGGQQIKPYHFKRSGCLVSDATYKFNQPCIVGTKPLGLVLASYVLGEKHVLPGLVISMDRVECRRYRIFADAARKSWPDVKLWAVRSSSMDEGTARGVYETILHVKPEKLEEAIGACIRSYNQKGAVNFRKTRGPNDQDGRIEIAVLLQPYQVGKCGGVATVADSSSNTNRQYQISVARTADQVTSGGETKEFKFSDGEQIPRNFISLVTILNRLHDVFGGMIQVEWVMDSSDRIIILQMEFMPIKTHRNEVDLGNDERIVEAQINSITDVRQIEAQKSSDALRIIIGSEIDAKSFQGELFAMVVRLGRRIREIKLSKPISPSSHFANICRHFGIKIL